MITEIDKANVGGTISVEMDEHRLIVRNATEEQAKELAGGRYPIRKQIPGGFEFFHLYAGPEADDGRA